MKSFRLSSRWLASSLFVVIGLFSASEKAFAEKGPQPDICLRSCWGARAPDYQSSYNSGLNRAIIHHTASAGHWSTTSLADSKADIRGVQNYHMDSRGWGDIGYHFLVDKLGHVFEARRDSMTGLPRGAHDGNNYNSMGFTMMGYFHTPVNNIPNTAILNALYAVIAWRMPSAWSPYGSGSYNGNTVGYLDGHLKVKATACPGDKMYPVHITSNYQGGPARDEIMQRKRGATKPDAPSNLRATAMSDDKIKLEWNDNSYNENRFLIERAPANTGPWNQVGTSPENDKVFSDIGLAPNTKYYYRIKAENGQGTSAASNIDNATTFDKNPPAAPTSLTAVAANDTKINLAWVDNAGAEDGFKVQQSTDGTNFTLIATVGINATSYSATGLKGNRTYHYRVRSYNTAGSSAFSNVASDTTPPTAPSNLVAVRGAGYDTIQLSWTDNSGAEVGFKIERGTASGGPFTQIATNAASDSSYIDTGLAPATTYWYRVRGYNANGNSAYSNTGSATTGNLPPVLSPIGNKTISATTKLSFTATSTDPNQNITSNLFQSFTSFAHNTPDGTVMFRSPLHNTATSGFLDTAVTNYTRVVSSFPAGQSGTRVLRGQFSFKTGTTNPWLYLTTKNPANVPNPTIFGKQVIRFRMHTSKALKVGMGVQETGTTAAIGADGGDTGDIERIGITNVVGGMPDPSRLVPANTWTTVSFNIPFEPVQTYTGNGVVEGNKVVLQHLVLVPAGGMGAYAVYMDDFEVVSPNTLTYSLDAGAPAGATIGEKTGIFSWTPTALQAGNWNITVRVTDQQGETDYETIRVTVTTTANNPPVLGAIGNKTVKEGTALAFTATSTDPDAGQTRTYSLDAGAPSGASINASSGAFSWTPTEAQGPGTYPLTVRVTDNGSPASNDWETISVAVSEVNVAPVVATISNATLNEGQTLNVTASATDADQPANSITYSLDAGSPAGATINPTTGAITWSTTEADGPDTYIITVRATDNGSPALSGTRSFTVTVNEVNIAPVLTVNTTVTTTTNIVSFESYDNGSFNGTVMFRQPSFSSSTTSFLDTTYGDLSSVTNTFPAGNTSSKALFASFKFKTGTTNPWLRFTTANAASQPNPTIDFTQKLRFDIYTDKALSIGLGLRETSTGAGLGANGGTSGTIEYVGVNGLTGTRPNPTRSVTAGSWTTLEFDIPNEAKTAFTGDGILTSTTGKGVLEHLNIVPTGGMGIYNVYLDNFKVVTVTTNLVADPGETITFTATATDADSPAQELTFSLDTGAPTNATIHPITGAFEWTPTAEFAGTTNTITIRVTDNGPGALSNAKNVSIVVRKVNTAPRIASFGEEEFLEVIRGDVATFTAMAEDDDVPANTLTFSLVGSVPSGASINPTTGVFTWTTPSNVSSTNVITVRVTDNGVPPLSGEADMTIYVVASNTAPVLALNDGKVTEKVVNFETFAHNTANGNVMFRRPNFSSTTTNFLNLTATNYTRVTTSFPTGNSTAGAKVLTAGWTFKTGQANAWLRLTTADAASIPNPTIDLTQKLRFKIYSTKALKVGLGLRETGTTAQIGANGGTTGDIEYVGVTNKISGEPIPNRLVTASNWTTLEFDLPNEPLTNFTGNSVLASGKGVLEHLILSANNNSGAFVVYVDNFDVITSQTMTNAIAMNTGSTLTFTAAGSDVDVPAQTLTYSLDSLAPAGASINASSGAFTWTPGTADAGTTNVISVFVQDAPANGAPVKMDVKSFVVAVTSDPVATQSVDTSGARVAANESVILTCEAVAGQIYRLQYKDDGTDTLWVDLKETVASANAISFKIDAAGNDRFYRVVSPIGEVSE